MANKAVFLDRDGTLNVDKGYVHRIADWEWIPGAIDALVALKSAGFLVIVVTNQAGIARNYYTDKEVNELHAWINRDLETHGIKIDGFYYCPHHPEFSGECECRKPMPGMLLQAKQDFDIDFTCSWLVGDKAGDVQAGLVVGVKSILVLTGYGQEQRTQLPVEALCSASIMEAGSLICNQAAQP